MKIFAQNQVGEVLNRLYDSEINAKIEWFWDGGFKISIGDFANGRAKKTDFQEFEELNFRRINEAISGLAFWAAALYPESEFAFWYNAAAESVCILYIEPVENGDTWIKTGDNIKAHTLTLRFPEQKQNDWNPLE